MWRKKFALNSFLRKYNNIEAKIESIYAFLQYWKNFSTYSQALKISLKEKNCFVYIQFIFKFVLASVKSLYCILSPLKILSNRKKSL
jgi:hypothetical protein